MNIEKLIERTKKHGRALMVVLIVLSMGLILAGGMGYVASLRDGLSDQSVQNVLAVTRQQQQALDNFISTDRERLHSYAQFFARGDHLTPEEVQRQLTMFNEVDAIFSVICLDDGWFCSNTSENIRVLDEEDLARYGALTGSGSRDSYVGLVSGDPKFGYYEAFTFSDGHKGLIQKSYDRAKVSATFSLSFYNGRGIAYVVNEKGDILLRSEGMIGDHLYDNIMDVLTGSHSREDDVYSLMAALEKNEAGSMTFSGDMGTFVYSYVPIESVEEWYLVSVVPEDAITEETDHILLNSQRAVGVLFAILLGCGASVLFVWYTHRNIQEKDREIQYQEQLFDIFSTYLSGSTNDVYMMLDRESLRVEYVSPNVERVLGIGQEAVMADVHAFGLPTYMDGTCMDLGVVGNMAPGDALEAMETQRVNQATGESNWFLESVYCTEMQGRAKIVTYISNRTQERKTQDALQDALKMAQVASKAKSTFLSSISHDIRTPMNAIMGIIALLRNEAENPELVLEYVERIDGASQHLLGLINDVLDMNKIESGSTTLNIGELNLAEVISELNTIIRPQARAKNQTFEIMTSSLSHEHLLGDKLRINQILINILSNAVKYTGEGGRIRLLAEELPQAIDHYCRIRFVISDNGQGMSEEYQKVMFDPFTREETEAVRQIQGTGLGMAITKSLVNLMGGSIKVESRLGMGSTFTVELELRIQEQEDDPQFWEKHGVRRMIVADDDVEVCAGVAAAMSRMGVTTDYATTGNTAVQMIRAAQKGGQPYDLFLLDWKMPGLNGLDTARAVRESYQDRLPILLFTAYDWEEIEHEAREIGVDHFLAKPFFMSSFKEAVGRIMGARPATEADDRVVEGKHVMVVDDIEVNRMILRKILTMLGAECDTAENGRQAVERFEQSRPGEYDLIMMDVQMPEMDGYAATRAIRSSGHPSAGEIPIIAMTANAFVDDIRDALEAGMDAHIAKPVQLDKLKGTIQQVLDSRSMQKTNATERKEL